MQKRRIGILDSFRTIAILAVLLFHFFSRYIVPEHPITLYPYGTQYDYFEYGYMGVHFFFMISGFIILYTLENTETFLAFWKKRFIRLMPSVFIASVITHIVCRLFDKGKIFSSSHYIENFIPSLTFITPRFFSAVSADFRTLNYISISYWSLWIEVQFYMYAGIIYFIDREKFMRNFLIITFALIFVNSIFMNVLESNMFHIDPENSTVLAYEKWIRQIFNLVVFIPLFVIGALFYSLFKGRGSNLKPPSFVYVSMFILMLFQLNTALLRELQVIYLAMFILFACFVYFPSCISFLDNKHLIRTGSSSYFLYLIHENIGVLIIKSWGDYFMPVGFVLPVMLILSFIILSIIYTEKVESKLNYYLKSKVLKPVI